METYIKREQDGEITLSIRLCLKGSCLSQEEALASALNELGISGTAEILKSYDNADSNIEVGGINYSSKGSKKKRINAPTEK